MSQLVLLSNEQDFKALEDRELYPFDDKPDEYHCLVFVHMVVDESYQIEIFSLVRVQTMLDQLTVAKQVSETQSCFM